MGIDGLNIVVAEGDMDMDGPETRSMNSSCRQETRATRYARYICKPGDDFYSTGLLEIAVNGRGVLSFQRGMEMGRCRLRFASSPMRSQAVPG